MKLTIPPSLVLTGHVDHIILDETKREMLKRGGGLAKLEKDFTNMLRDAVDSVIMTPKTGRRAYVELEKTEKTYIGTRVEIELRSLLKLQKGKLDTVILGRDVDIKHTMGGNWMIPTEAIDQICILCAADEKSANAYLGLIVARPAYLTTSSNKDSKKSISAVGFEHILWLLNGVPYLSRPG